MRTLLQTMVHNVVVATTMPSSRQNASVTSTDQRRRRHKEKSTTHATVAPVTTSVHGRTKPIDSSVPGIADVGLREDGNAAVYHINQSVPSASDLERFRSTHYLPFHLFLVLCAKGPVDLKHHFVCPMSRPTLGLVSQKPLKIYFFKLLTDVPNGNVTMYKKCKLVFKIPIKYCTFYVFLLYFVTLFGSFSSNFAQTYLRILF